MDIDENENISISEALDHLKTHKRVLIRRSVNGNLHALVFNDINCLECKQFVDENYQGKVLFNNKGSVWGELDWKDIHTEEIVFVPSENLVHLLVKIVDINGQHLNHIFTDVWYLLHHEEEILPDIPTASEMDTDIEIFYTFHSIITNTEERHWENEDVSGDKKKKFGKLMELYDFKAYEGVIPLLRDYVHFVTHLPQEIVD